MQKRPGKDLGRSKGTHMNDFSNEKAVWHFLQKLRNPQGDGDITLRFLQMGLLGWLPNVYMALKLILPQSIHDDLSVFACCINGYMKKLP
jgi:hypothetical protein